MLEIILALLNNKIYITGVIITFSILVSITATATAFVLLLICSEKENFPTILFMIFSLLLVGLTSSFITSLMWPIFWPIMIVSVLVSFHEFRRRMKQDFIDKLKGIL